MSRYKAYPEYKDSGVEWLGEIPPHWHSRQLKYLCSYNDEVLSETVGDDFEIEYVDIGSVSAIDGISGTETLLFGNAPSRARRIVRDGDILISTVRTYLEAIASVKAPPNNLIASTGFAVIRPNAFLHKGYAAYCLRASGFIKEVVARSVGVSYPAINASDLVNIKTPEPSPTEQENIAAFLDHETAKIDALIEKQQRLIELLKEKRQAVISHAVTKGLNPNAPMKDSGVEWLGEVPAHWEVLPIKYLSDSIGTGGTPKSEFSFTEELEISWFTPGDFSTHAKLISSTKHVTNRALANGDAKVFRASSILVIGIGATLGKVALCESNFSCNQQINVVSPNSKVKAEFLVNSLQAQTEQMKQSSNFSTIGIMNQEKTKQLVVAVPPLTEQVAVAVFLDEKKMKFDAIESHAVNQIALLQERRTALISAAVTGKIDVRDWQAAA